MCHFTPSYSKSKGLYYHFNLCAHTRTHTHGQQRMTNYRQAVLLDAVFLDRIHSSDSYSVKTHILRHSQIAHCLKNIFFIAQALLYTYRYTFAYIPEYVKYTHTCSQSKIHMHALSFLVCSAVYADISLFTAIQATTTKKRKIIAHSLSLLLKVSFYNAKLLTLIKFGILSTDLFGHRCAATHLVSGLTSMQDVVALSA